MIYPDQTALANPAQCWEWFEPENQRRGAGEPAAIAGMSRDVRSEFAIDDSAVYLAGFSAGGAMAPIMAAAYPDLYAVVGVHSGLEYDAANSALGAPAAMSFGGPDPQEQGKEAYEEMGERAGVVRTIVVHGEEDYTIDPINGDQAAAQAIRTNDLAADGTDEQGLDTTHETVRRERSSGHHFLYRSSRTRAGTCSSRSTRSRGWVMPGPAVRPAASTPSPTRRMRADSCGSFSPARARTDR
ncbi:hypothetical protein BRC86_02225 [Halobacteriales archaeon QS_3_64_16]|nr:MAG: hypothetical protein BRC86_02225 [Halobacteriales archaeon QS_3_64_16]